MSANVLKRGHIESVETEVLLCFTVTKILRACDKLRDDSLPELGVRLEDVEGKCRDFLFFHSLPESVDEIFTIQMKAIAELLLVVLFITLYKIILIIKNVIIG